MLGQLTSFSSDSEMKGYESDLARWATAVKEEVSYLMNENIDEQSTGIKMLLKLSNSESYRQKLREHAQVLDSCSTYEHETAWKEVRKTGNATLFQRIPEYDNWKIGQDSSTLLFLGKLGAVCELML